jgi:hypothetical protein
MFTSIWIAIVFLAATPECATDACLWEQNTLSIHTQDMEECEDVIAAFREHEDVSYSKCIEVKLD